MYGVVCAGFLGNRSFNGLNLNLKQQLLYEGFLIQKPGQPNAEIGPTFQAQR